MTKLKNIREPNISNNIEILHVAIEQGDIDRVVSCIADGVDIEERFNQRFSLDRAIVSGHANIVKLLLSEGAYPDFGCFPPILEAIVRNRVDIVEMLIDAYADVNRNLEDRSTPLIVACIRGYAQIVRILVDAGAEVNARDDEGSTPLMIAACQGSLEIVKFLIDQGADVNLEDDCGENAVSSAAAVGQLQTCQYLYPYLEQNIHIRHSTLNKALLRIAVNGGRREIINYLYQMGGNINMRNEECLTLLMTAAQYSQQKVAESLIELGADLNAIDNQSRTALMFAVQFQYTFQTSIKDINEANYKIVQHFIQAGADLQRQDINGKTALMYATEFSSTDIVDLLLQSGARVNEKDIQGIRALTYAKNREAFSRFQRERKANIIQLLLNAGATED